MRHPFLRTLAGQGRDANFKNTVLLLHGDGTNGAQNNTFVDGSSNNFTITRNGNTTQGSFSPYGDNWSNYFDGTGDYLSLANNAAFDFGTGDFTVEAWVYLDSTVNPGRPDNLKTVTLFSTGSSGTNDCAFSIYGNTTTPGVGLELYQNSPSIAFSVAAPVSTNAWVHIAYVRTGTTIYGFVNGLRYTLGTTSSAISSTTAPKIGTANTTSYTNQFKGYISNLRILKGTAQYTSNFTPATTPLTAITNTSLLTCQSNRFRDNSANAFAITRNGDVSVQRFSPFAPSAAYSTSAIGGSGYFDGTGDTLTTDATTAFDFANNNFTIEAWIYTTSFATGQGICANQDNGGVSTLDGWVFGLNTDASISFQDWTNTTTVLNLTSSANVIRLNNWHHVVVEKRGTGTNQIQVFVDGVAVATGTRNANIPASTSNQPLTIGNWRYSADTNREFTGYIAGLRIVNSAVYNGTVTVPTAPLTAVTNTSLLCNFTNAGIYDNAMMNDLETVGNAQISTTQKKYGTGALYFDGTGDYLTMVDHPGLRLPADDFTIEYWFYVSAFPSSTAGQDLMYMINKGGVQGSFDYDYGIVFTNSSGNIKTKVALTDGATIRLSLTGATTISTAIWYHLAFTRSGSTGRLFINGTQDATGTVTGNVGASTRPLLVGYETNASSRFYFNGYIDDLRITKGVARYTANFTPPNVPLADF